VERRLSVGGGCMISCRALGRRVTLVQFGLKSIHRIKICLR
jgi:hypothetical protein